MLFLLAALGLGIATATAGVRIDEQVFGDKLGGWTKRGNQAAEYPLSGATYRTYKPEISPTPDGGIFISLRIDHMRGWLASDDYAVLEITVNEKGTIVSAQSNIAIQGRAITSDVIKAGGDVAKGSAAENAVKIGADMVSDLSAKLLREKIVEAGRVSFPAVLRHNYNLLFQAIRNDDEEKTAGGSPAPDAKPPTGAKLEVKPYGDTPKPPDLPAKN